jgi:hypothetical protein
MKKIKIKGWSSYPMLYDFSSSGIMGSIIIFPHFWLILGHLSPSWLEKKYSVFDQK